MVRRRLIVAPLVALALAACGGDNGLDGPPGDPPDAVSLAGMAARIADAIREEAGIEATVECPDSASVDDDGDVVTFCQATAADGSRVEVVVASLSRPEHLDFGLSLANVPAIEEGLEAQLGGEVDCPDLVDSGEGEVVSCTARAEAGDDVQVKVTLGRFDDDFTFAIEPPA